jgi:hypothetical protein
MAVRSCTSHRDPSGLPRAETFWNSRGRDLAITVPWSVPAFPLAEASVGPRASGNVAQCHATLTLPFEREEMQMTTGRFTSLSSLISRSLRASADGAQVSLLLLTGSG